MKKIIAIVTVSLLALGFAIYMDFSSRTYSDGKETRTYDTGYEEGISIGYDMGYEEGKNLIHKSEEEAVYYARKHSEWHPEEALMIIDAYENNEPFLGDSPPSEEDYRAAIRSLYLFYEYYYCDMYKDLD